MENGNATLLALASGLIGYSFGAKPDVSNLIYEKLGHIDRELGIIAERLKTAGGNHSGLQSTDLSSIENSLKDIITVLDEVKVAVDDINSNKDHTDQIPNHEIMKPALDLLKNVEQSIKSLNDTIHESSEITISIRDHLTSKDDGQSLDEIKQMTQDIRDKL